MEIEKIKIKSPFIAPASFFEELEEQIISQKNISEFSKKGPFIIENDYFNNLESHILSEIKLSKNKKSLNFKIPENYFDNLETNILSEVSLGKIKNEKLFLKEGQYFDALEKQILSKTIKSKKSNFNVFVRNFKIYRNAAAVLVFGVIGYIIYNNSKPKDQFTEISSTEMITYLEEQSISEEEITPVLDQTIINELNVIPSNLDIFDAELLEYSNDNNI